MKALTPLVAAALALCLPFATPALAGPPKATHPCYAVADCKTKTTQPEFSACIKAHQAEADALPGCAAFRKDKDAYMKQHGVPNLDALFEG